MRYRAICAAGIAIALAVLALSAFGPAAENEPDAAAAQRTALGWAEAELADAPRRVGDKWEVDVRRADGSVVEVTLGRELELHELDEELGPGGTPAHDQVVRPLRNRAIAAARPAAKVSGPVRSVERESDGTIEVDFLAPDRTVLEVELGRGLRVTDTDREDIGDE